MLQCSPACSARCRQRIVLPWRLRAAGSSHLGRPHFNLPVSRQQWHYITQISAGLQARLCRNKRALTRVRLQWAPSAGALAHVSPRAAKESSHSKAAGLQLWSSGLTMLKAFMAALGRAVLRIEWLSAAESEPAGAWRSCRWIYGGSVCQREDWDSRLQPFLAHGCVPPIALFVTVTANLFPRVPLVHLPLFAQGLLMVETGHSKCQKTLFCRSSHFLQLLNFHGPSTLP